jgi:hypothetical protein
MYLVIRCSWGSSHTAPCSLCFKADLRVVVHRLRGSACCVMATASIRHLYSVEAVRLYVMCVNN